MKRGVLKVSDLYSRSERRPGSDCWWWTHAKSNGQPRIYTFCHDRGEKMALSGPKAVWNIANGRGTAGRHAYMRCVSVGCVNPHHVAIAATRKQIGENIARSGLLKGVALDAKRANLRKARAAQGRRPTAPDIVHAIRQASGSHREIGRLFGIGPSVVWKMRTGRSHKHLEAA
jgi:hypothetical protein